MCTQESPGQWSGPSSVPSECQWVSLASQPKLSHYKNYSNGLLPAFSFMLLFVVVSRGDEDAGDYNSLRYRLREQGLGSPNETVP